MTVWDPGRLTRDESAEVLMLTSNRMALHSWSGSFLDLTGLDRLEFDRYVLTLKGIGNMASANPQERVAATRWLLETGFHLGEALVEGPARPPADWPVSVTIARRAPGPRLLVVPRQSDGEVQRYRLGDE